MTEERRNNRCRKHRNRDETNCIKRKETKKKNRKTETNVNQTKREKKRKGPFKNLLRHGFRVLSGLLQFFFQRAYSLQRLWKREREKETPKDRLKGQINGEKGKNDASLLRDDDRERETVHWGNKRRLFAYFINFFNYFFFFSFFNYFYFYFFFYFINFESLNKKNTWIMQQYNTSKPKARQTSGSSFAPLGEMSP